MVVDVRVAPEVVAVIVPVVADVPVVVSPVVVFFKISSIVWKACTGSTIMMAVFALVCGLEIVVVWGECIGDEELAKAAEMMTEEGGEAKTH